MVSGSVYSVVSVVWAQFNSYHIVHNSVVTVYEPLCLFRTRCITSCPTPAGIPLSVHSLHSYCLLAKHKEDYSLEKSNLNRVHTFPTNSTHYEYKKRRRGDCTSSCVCSVVLPGCRCRMRGQRRMHCVLFELISHNHSQSGR